MATRTRDSRQETAAAPSGSAIAAAPAVDASARPAAARRDAVGAASEGSSYQRVTDRVLAAIERGQVPWAMPWVNHQNLEGRPYRGVNAWLLSLEQHKSPYWLTSKQMEAFREAGQDIRLAPGTKPAQAFFWLHAGQQRDMAKPVARTALSITDAEVIDRARLIHDFLAGRDDPDQNGRALGAQGYRQTVFDDGWVARVRGPIGHQAADVTIGRPDMQGRWHVSLPTDGDPRVTWYSQANPLPVGTAAIPWDSTMDPVPGAGLDLFRRAPGHEADGGVVRVAEMGLTRTAPPVLRSYTIYNCDDVTGWDVAKLSPAIAQRIGGLPVTPDRTAALAEAESIVAAMPNRPVLKDGSKAFYVPSTDEVHCPPMERFPDRTRYYETLFHELGHSTGHASRLDRDMSGSRFGDHDQKALYSREELVAEMTTAYLMGKAGLLSDNVVAQSATYLKGWASYIKTDPKAMVVAAAQAQKAADFILGVSHTAAADEAPF